MLRVSRRKPVRTTVIRKAAVTPEEEFIEMVRAALEAIGAPQLTDEVISAMTNGDADPLLDTLNWVDFIRELRRVQSILSNNSYAAGVGSFSWVLNIKRADNTIVAPLKMTGSLQTVFEYIDKNTVNWATQQSARLVVQISEEMRMTIRRLVAQSVGGIYTPQELARQIAMFIPLHERWATAVLRRRDNLLEELLKAGVKPDEAKRRAIERAETYAKKLTRLRSRTIARTELAFANGEGVMEGWRQANNAGLIGVGWQKEWLTAEDERVCPTCGPMNGVKVAWDAPFGFGGLTPPLHPNCRCDVALIPDEVNF